MARPLPVSGPYELVEWRINDKIRLRKNPRYWDAANTKSELVDFLPIGSANTALNLYETGAADIVWDKSLVPNELVDVLIKRPDFHTSTILGSYFVRFNVTKKHAKNHKGGGAARRLSDAAGHGAVSSTAWSRSRSGNGAQTFGGGRISRWKRVPARAISFSSHGRRRGEVA